MKTVCVYCGSSPGARPEYGQAASRLAAEIARRGMTLVYGGAAKGTMGVLANAMLGEGGRVIGVIPRHLVDKEIGHDGLTELHVVESMHERKAMMAEMADCFVALPGGFGTLEELIETVTWAQLGIHAKPCGLLNVCGYYDGLVQFATHASREGFLRPQHLDMLLIEESPAALFERFEEYVPPVVAKWTD